MRTLIILNEAMEDIMKIVKFFEVSGLLIKGANEKLKMKQKNKNGNFLVCY